jgi:hypothetical protein
MICSAIIVSKDQTVVVAGASPLLALANFRTLLNLTVGLVG